MVFMVKVQIKVKLRLSIGQGEVKVQLTCRFQLCDIIICTIFSIMACQGSDCVKYCLKRDTERKRKGLLGCWGNSLHIPSQSVIFSQGVIEVLLSWISPESHITSIPPGNCSASVQSICISTWLNNSFLCSLNKLMHKINKTLAKFSPRGPQPGRVHFFACFIIPDSTCLLITKPSERLIMWKSVSQIHFTKPKRRTWRLTYPAVLLLHQLTLASPFDLKLLALRQAENSFILIRVSCSCISAGWLEIASLAALFSLNDTCYYFTCSSMCEIFGTSVY